VIETGDCPYRCYNYLAVGSATPVTTLKTCGVYGLFIREYDPKSFGTCSLIRGVPTNLVLRLEWPLKQNNYP
jgi:hypothetical protein